VAWGSSRVEGDIWREEPYIPLLMGIAYVILLTSLPVLASVPANHVRAGVTHAAAVPPVLSQSQSGPDADTIETSLLQAAPMIRPEALRAALSAWETLHAQGKVSHPLLTVIDYGLSSMAKRMWVFDLESRRLLFHELVAHGRNSGEDLAQLFSNDEGSLMTSLGAFVTGTTYNGRNGYSLHLRGAEPGLNDRAETRTIVVHGAPYVSEAIAQKLGRLGRSLGCPAVRTAIARTLIDTIKDHTILYAWHPSLEKPALAAATATAAR